MKKNRDIISQTQSLGDWYTSVIEQAELIHYSAIKGFMSFLPRGWAIWEQIQKHLSLKFAELNIKNVALPSLFPYSDLKREAHHIAGFNPELFLIKEKGDESLSDPYVLRPTSETAFCKLWSETLKNQQQLPLLYNQWCSVFRVEKNTRPFLRNSEFYWQEMHGAVASAADNKTLVQTLCDAYQWLINDVLMIPTINGEKTPNERFAGAEHTFTFETIMPDGQALQSATSHNLGQNFAKAFNIKFQNSANRYEYVHTMSAGISTRIIGGLIMSHGDDGGLVLPFKIAPVQICIIPLFAQKQPAVQDACQTLAQTLQRHYRVEVSTANTSLGATLSQNEVYGVPFQIIIGPNDLKDQAATITNRINEIKMVVKLDEIENWISEQAKQFDQTLYAQVKKRYAQQIVECQTFAAFKQALEQRKVILAPWGGDDQDEQTIKQQTGATARCINLTKPIENLKCFFSNKPATHWVYFARAY